MRENNEKYKKQKRKETSDEKSDLIIVRGAGDLATGTIHRLKKSGFRLLVLETDHPAASEDRWL